MCACASLITVPTRYATGGRGLPCDPIGQHGREDCAVPCSPGRGPGEWVSGSNYCAAPLERHCNPGRHCIAQIVASRSTIEVHGWAPGLACKCSWLARVCAFQLLYWGLFGTFLCLFLYIRSDLDAVTRKTWTTTSTWPSWSLL